MKARVYLEHEQHDCVLYAPHVGAAWCGCHFLVELGGKAVASVRDADALAAVKRLLGVTA